MDSRERMAVAMQGGEPDRVPVMCQLALGHYFLNACLKPHEIWFTSEGFADALVTMQRRYRFDGILINIPGRPPDLLDRMISLEEGRDGQVVTWDDGSATFLPWDDNPYHTLPGPGAQVDWTGQNPLPRADFESLDPDHLEGIDALTGYVWGVYHVPWLPGKKTPGPLTDVPDYFYRTIDLVRERVGNRVSVHGEVFSPFTHFLELFGYEMALLYLLSDPDKASSILDRLTQAPISWGVAQANRGVDAVLISSAFAGGPFLSREMYRRFVVPYECRVAEAIRATGVPVYTHTCGSIGDRLDLMEETRTMGIDTMDPPPLGNTELAVAKAQVGSRLFLKGNMNAVELLRFKKPEEVIAHARDRIVTGKPGGGYILSTACSVAPRMEPWKLELLVPLAEELGLY